MRKILITAGIVVFFFVLLGLVVIKLLPERDPDQNSVMDSAPAFDPALANQSIDSEASADTVVKECYKWYLRYYPSVTSSQYDDLAANATVQRCFTADLIESWKDFMEVSETDPILISNGYEDTWQTDVQANVVSQLSQSSTVELLLGAGVQTHQLSITLRRGQGPWQIQSVAYIAPMEQE